MDSVNSNFEKDDDVSVVGEQRLRKTLRFYESDWKKFEFWANEKQMSVNEFLTIAVNQYIEVQNGNYHLETLEQQRLNQLIDETHMISENVKSLSSIVVSSMGSITKLANGSNFLYEE